MSLPKSVQLSLKVCVETKGPRKTTVCRLIVLEHLQIEFWLSRQILHAINHCKGCQSFKCYPSLILNIWSSTLLPVERPMARIQRCRRRRRWGSRGGRRGGWGCTGGWRGRTLELLPLRAGPRQLHCDNVFLITVLSSLCCCTLSLAMDKRGPNILWPSFYFLPAW